MGQQRVQPSAGHYTVVVTTCERSDEWALALQLLGVMLLERVRPETQTFNALQVACGKGHLWQLAFLNLATMTSLCTSPDADTFNASIRACANAARWAEAAYLLAEMRQRGLQCGGVTYKAMIKSCVGGGLWHQAVEHLVAMRQQSTMPDAVAYGRVIGVCAGGERRDVASGLLDELRARGPPFDVHKSNLLMECEQAALLGHEAFLLHAVGTPSEGGLFSGPWWGCTAEALAAMRLLEGGRSAEALRSIQRLALDGAAGRLLAARLRGTCALG